MGSVRLVFQRRSSDRACFLYFIVVLSAAVISLATGLTPFASAETTAEKLTKVPLIQPFDGSTESASNFSTKWSRLLWGAAKGSENTEGWRPTSTFPTENGIYYNATTIKDEGVGLAAIATMATSPGISERHFSLWLDVQMPTEAKSGYEFRFTTEFMSTYEIQLVKWLSGKATVLKSQTGYTFINGNSFALVDIGTQIAAWTNTGSGFNQVLTAVDTSYSSGYVGVSGAGNNLRVKTFKAGVLEPEYPETEIYDSPVNRSLSDVAFQFTDYYGGTNFECSLDGAAFSSCTTPKTYQNLAVKSHTFKVRAKNAAGLVDPTPDERTFQVMTAPTYIANVPLLDVLEREEVPLATGEWSKMKWAEEIGGVWMGSFRGFGSTSGLAGAYWNSSEFSAQGNPLIVAATVGTGATPKGERLSLWLDMPWPKTGNAQGFEARFEGTDGTSTHYKVELARWLGGNRTVMASTPSTFSLPVGTHIILADSGARITVWAENSLVLAAEEAIEQGGYAGLEVYGPSGTMHHFRAGVY